MPHHLSLYTRTMYQHTQKQMIAALQLAMKDCDGQHSSGKDVLVQMEGKEAEACHARNRNKSETDTLKKLWLFSGDVGDNSKDELEVDRQDVPLYDQLKTWTLVVMVRCGRLVDGDEHRS